MARSLLRLCVGLLLGAGASAQCSEDAPEGLVQCLLKAMSLDEKLQFFAGDLDAQDHISGVSRLGIPAINMGDGPNGVANTIAGTATSFPCNMAAADTFDKELVGEYAQAMAKEFKAKGKNQILGPGANLARVSECGRMDEYMAGDDPVLGAELVSAFVKGALREHVMTTVKHLGNNEQETNRNKWSANPDTYVQMELYLKPFVAAAKAGAASMMCGYNMLGGVHACENKGMLQAVKKEGGDGFTVVSDWGAVYEDAANGGIARYIDAGLDIEMGTFDTADCGGDIAAHPDSQATQYGGAGYCNAGFYMLKDRMRALVDQGKVTQERVDETVSRVLKGLHTAGLLDPKVQAEFPAYTQQDLHSKWFGPLMQKDARTQNSRRVAREVATKAMVLLQNTGSLLPLAPGSAVEMYGCGDEVHFRAEVGSAAGTEPNIPPAGQRCQADDQTACPFPEDAVKAAGLPVQSFRLADADAGPRDPGAVAIVCVTAASKNAEGTDRTNLDLLGSAIPWEKFQRTVVYVLSPGPVLMPFAPRADAVLLSSLPGEMGGAAFADILLGKAHPTGRLSLTMPNRMHETDLVVNPISDNYDEDLLIGYRWYGARGQHPNFAFGWGLGYARHIQLVAAELGAPAGDRRPFVTVKLWCGVAVDKSVELGQVVQLYVQHEAPRRRDFLQLAGFGKLRRLEQRKLVIQDIEFEEPRTWGSPDGDKAGWEAGWEAVSEYTVFVSLYGAEHAQPLFAVKVAGGAPVATPAHNFAAKGPLNFDQDAAVFARASARGLAGAQPAAYEWGAAPEELDDQRPSAGAEPVEQFERVPIVATRGPRGLTAVGLLALLAAAAGAVTLRSGACSRAQRAVALRAGESEVEDLLMACSAEEA